MKTIVLFLSICALAQAEDLKTPRNLWRLSMASLATANILDSHSSWGKHELNSQLANQQGKFGAQGMLIKFGMQGAAMGVEYLLTRGRPTGKIYRRLAFINFGATAVVAGTAVHNYRIPGSH